MNTPDMNFESIFSESGRLSTSTLIKTASHQGQGCDNAEHLRADGRPIGVKISDETLKIVRFTRPPISIPQAGRISDTQVGSGHFTAGPPSTGKDGHTASSTWNLATHHPPVEIDNPSITAALTAIETVGFTDPDVIEAVDVEANTAFHKAWYSPYVCYATDTLVRAGAARGLKCGEVAAQVQIERTAFSDLHHHGEGSAANIVRILAHPALAAAEFDYSGRVIRNVMGRSGNIAAIRTVAAFHGRSDGEIDSFGVLEYEMLCWGLRTTPTSTLQNSVTDADVADLIRDVCGPRGERLIPPWLSKTEAQIIRNTSSMLTTSVAPREWLRKLIDTWLRPMIHAYFVVEGAGFNEAWNEHTGVGNVGKCPAA